MTDILERLDNINICMCDYMTRDSNSDCETLDDAKDTITRLRAEIERLRAALERMLLEFDFMVEGGVIPDVRNDIIFVEARAALQQEVK